MPGFWNTVTPYFVAMFGLMIFLSTAFEEDAGQKRAFLPFVCIYVVTLLCCFSYAMARHGGPGILAAVGMLPLTLMLLGVLALSLISTMMPHYQGLSYTKRDPDTPPTTVLAGDYAVIVERDRVLLKRARIPRESIRNALKMTGFMAVQCLINWEKYGLREPWTVFGYVIASLLAFAGIYFQGRQIWELLAFSGGHLLVHGVRYQRGMDARIEVEQPSGLYYETRILEDGNEPITLLSTPNQANAEAVAKALREILKQHQEDPATWPPAPREAA